MGLQDLFCDVVVFDIAEPPIQLGDQDHIDLILLYVFKKPQEALAVLHWLAGGDSLIGVAINDNEAVTLCVLGERPFLGREGEAVEVLLFGAYTDVDCTAFDFRHWLSSYYTYIEKAFSFLNAQNNRSYLK